MQSRAYPSQTRLWLVSLAASVVVNALVIAGVAVWTAEARTNVQNSLAKAVAPEEVPLVFLAPVMEALKPKPAAEAAPAMLRKNTVDTSAEQKADAPEKRTSESERNTRATSNTAPVEGAPALPSLSGSEPDDGRKLATYRSDYKEGNASHSGQGDPERTEAAAPVPTSPAIKTPVQSPSPVSGQPKVKAALPGTAPVDRPVFRQPELPEAPASPAAPEVPPLPQDPKPQQDDGISEEKKPTQLEGSVTAIGAGSQEATDTPEARYIATVRRSVERHWQANLVRSRDFNLAGTAIVHVTIDPSGKVLRASFDDKDGLGQVQKGYMYSSIKDHQHPPMPDELKKKVKNKPFEFNLGFTIRS